MELKSLIEKYLAENKMLQVATVDGDQPWICTVYFVADSDMNVYWISKPDRRHSKEIKKHAKAAAAAPVKFTPGEDVVGLQIEGEAEEVKDLSEIKKAIRLYTDRFDRGEEFYEEFVSGKNPHKLYKITPRSIVVFDEENFEEARQEFNLQSQEI